MIQRIQTLFLLLAIITLGVFLWMPLLQLQAASFIIPIQGWEIHEFYQGYFFFVNAIATGIAAGFALLAIFLFKKRNLQTLFCWFSALFIVFAQALVYYKYQTRVFVGDVIFTWWNLLSLLALIFVLLAIVNIRKDEQLVKNTDRLR